MKIPERMRQELEEQFSPEQVEEGLKRLAWIIRVRDRGEDCQTVLNELGIALSVHSYRKYKRKLDLYGIRGLIPKKVPRWKFTPEVRAYARGVATGKTAGLSARQLKMLLEAEFERQFSLSKTRELMNELQISRQAEGPEKPPEGNACENADYFGFREACLQELGLEETLMQRLADAVNVKREASESRPNYKNKDESGHFNHPPGTFKTVDTRDDINYRGHDLAKTSTRCNARKMRKLISLPLTTAHGRLSELAESSSNTMRQAFCGFLYQPATIDKFLRELT